MTTAETISPVPINPQPTGTVPPAPQPVPSGGSRSRKIFLAIPAFLLSVPLIVVTLSGSFRLWKIGFSLLPQFFATRREIIFSENSRYSPETFVLNLIEYRTANKDLSFNSFVIESPDYIRHVPTNIADIPSLAFLHISDSPILTLPETISSLRSLRIVRIFNTNISSLPSTFGNLDNLQYAFLAGNRLKKLPDAFGDLKNLGALFLAYNNLESLPPSFANLTNLLYLDLTGNRFRSFPSPLPPNLQVLFIGGNPIPRTTLVRMEKILSSVQIFY